MHTDFRQLVWLAVSLLVSSVLAISVRGETSALWGKQGEVWTPQSRLPDFSHAGYHGGEISPPHVPVVASVKDFGATGDGTTDDTAAFLAAIAAARPGAIEIPPGRYRITKVLRLTRPGIVLRGTGPDQTVLYFPVPLNDLEPDWGATTEGQRTSNYSWSGGFVRMQGDLREKILTRITAPAWRGDQTLTVADSGDLHPGQRIVVCEHDNLANTLAAELYSGDPGGMSELLGSARVELACHIVRVSGSRIEIDRPLRCDLRAEWEPTVQSFDPTVTECGVEDLTFRFPNQPYPGHFKELGYNAVTFVNASDCWARHLRIVNADSGIFAMTFFCTIQGVTLESERAPDRTGSTGHHGIAFYGQDNLLEDFNFKTKFIHDLTLDGGAAGNVSVNGRAVDLCFDGHKRACCENLFANIDAGAGTRLWSHGGGAELGRPCAARNTFWNIRAARPQKWPAGGYGPDSMNLVGVQPGGPSETNADGRWFEAIPPAEIEPQDIHAAQLARRMAALK